MEHESQTVKAVQVSKRNTNLLAKAIELDSLTPAIIDSLGKGVDVFASSPYDGLRLSIFDLSKSGTKTVNADNKEFQIPAMTDLIPHPNSHVNTGSSTSIETVTNSLALSVGVSIQAGFFSAGVKGEYKKSSSETRSSYYAYINDNVTFADITLNSMSSEYFSNDFAADLNALPTTFSSEHYSQFAGFFKKWGFYFLSHCSLGGQLNAFNAVRMSSSTSEQTAKADLEAQYNGLFYSGSISSSVTATQSWSVFSSMSESVVNIEGGSLAAQHAIIGLNALEPSQVSVDAYSNWADSIAESPSPIKMFFTPISAIAGNKATALEQAAKVCLTNINFDNSTHWSGGRNDLYNGTASLYINKQYITPETVTNNGIQVVALNRKSQQQIELNKFYSFDPENWQQTSDEMWNNIYDDIKNYNGDYSIIFKSVNVLMGCYPPPTVALYIENVLGIGNLLRTWTRGASPTSISSPGTSSIVFNTVGIPHLGTNTGMAFCFSLWEMSSEISTYQVNTGASVLLNPDGSASIVSFQD